MKHSNKVVGHFWYCHRSVDINNLDVLINVDYFGQRS